MQCELFHINLNTRGIQQSISVYIVFFTRTFSVYQTKHLAILIFNYFHIYNGKANTIGVIVEISLGPNNAYTKSTVELFAIVKWFGVVLVHYSSWCHVLA